MINLMRAFGFIRGQNMASTHMPLKKLTFTTVHRTTTYTYTTMTFTEADFIALLSDEKKAKWAGLGPIRRAIMWSKLKDNFPFDLGPKGTLDPHANWIEAWDDEVIKEVDMAWDHHEHIKSEIIAATVHMNDD